MLNALCSLHNNVVLYLQMLFKYFLFKYKYCLVYVMFLISFCVAGVSFQFVIVAVHNAYDDIVIYLIFWIGILASSLLNFINVYCSQCSM